MKKVQKKQIEEFLELLGAVHAEIQEAIKGNQTEEALGLLVQCQQGVIELGNLIEKEEKDTSFIIRKLEKYCEYIFGIYEQLHRNENVNARDIYENMQEQLCAIQADIQNNISVKKEVVFLPYKASMWDSLESVWMAATKDENCDAYVIPIPYFDKKPDGTFGEMHYEGNKYPDYVPITSWQEYDLAVRRPDVIFIHNPYDEGNYVTSVHPFFYAKKLKQFTDMLVYIPYFVCSESTREENCVLSGVWHADKVVVQSEAIKAEYTRYWEKALGTQIPADKFLVVGSPKFDKVIHCDEMNSDILQRLRQLKGNKKVILYNTHLKTFLRYEQEAIDKLESVFHYFASCEDVMLLWRPHPLTKTTLKVMKPELYASYCKLESKYINDRIGIYDDNADMYPAMAIADAYYGDSSSLLSLFGVTGKAICMQQVAVTEYGMTGQCFEGACIEGNLIYYANATYNALMLYNMATGKAEYIDEFPQVAPQKQRIIGNMAKWKNRLWMFPFNENRIFTYDMEKREWDTVELPEPWKEKTVSTCFAGLQVEQYFYVFGCREYGVVCLNMENGEISFCQSNIDTYKEAIGESTGGVCRQDCCKVGNNLYVACTRANVVLEYNILNNEIQIYRVGDCAERFATLCYDGKFFWITTMDGNIIRWCKETNEIFLPEVKMEKYVKGIFGSSLYAKGYVWFFAYSGNMNIRINTETLQIECTYIFKTPYSRRYPCRVGKGWFAGNKVYFMDVYNSFIVEMDEHLNTKIYEIPIDRERLLDLWNVNNAVKYVDYIHIENAVMNLDTYVSYITRRVKTDEGQKACFLEFSEDKDGCAGSKIYRNIVSY